MAERRRHTPSANAARLAIAGVIVAGGALSIAGQAGADPELPYPPVPAISDGSAPAPGQPVVDSGEAPVAAPAPPPVGPPVVPEIANPNFGSGSGPIGSLRDIYHQVRDGSMPGMNASQGELAPPPGAGPAPKLPPGFTSLTDPSSSTPALPKDPNATGPALPPGYYPLNGPPPPGYAPPAAPVDAAAPPTDAPLPPTP